jgi:hypothetical protein
MGRNKLCLLICENYKREAAAIIKGRGFADVTLLTFPAVCCNSQGEMKALSDFIPLVKNKCGHIAFIGSKCAKRFKPLSDKKVQLRLKQPEQCFYMFINKKIIDRYLKERTYLLTPGFLEKWRKCIKEMELDQKSARKFFSLSYSRLVLLDTGTGKNTVRNLQQFSKYLNLPYEIVPVGLDHFRIFLKEIILEWRLEKEKMKGQFQATALKEVERREHKRFSIDRTCLVEMNNSDMVELKDISLGGIRLSIPLPLPADIVHTVKIFPSIKNEINLTGTVVWSSSKKSHNYETGLKFVEINENLTHSLEQFFNILNKPVKK